AFDAQGRNVAASEVLPEPRPGIADRPYFQTVMSTNSPSVSDVLISRGTGRPIVVMAVPIRGDTGQPIGVVITNLRLDQFPRLLESIRLQPGQAMFLADRTGHLAFHTRRPELTLEERDASAYPPIRSALEGKPFRGVDVPGLFGEDRVVVTTTVGNYGWVIGLSTPSRLALAPVMSAVRNGLILYAAVTVFGIALALLIARYLLQPLRELTANAIALGRGELQRRVRIKTGDELETLGESFNTMAENMQKTLQLREEFLTVASHELKTPLTVIKGYIQLLLRDERDPARRKSLDAVVRHADRISELIGEMLQMAQLQAGPLELRQERLDLAALTQEIAGEMQATAQKHRLLLCSAGPVWVHGDRERLEIVLRHLLDNAIRYSPKGGDVDVEVVAADGFARVTVIDHGLGVPREKQEHIFEPFFQVYPALAPFGGMGLGLHISKRIVEAHGGKIWFESEEEKGSSFHFTLPRAPDGIHLSEGR
ncbi:MAG: sensor histidine kinase, partial [Dehalococcoidales bacterium]|nr:sensor histidine kinase [Dehalococcoidales bacterium]